MMRKAFRIIAALMLGGMAGSLHAADPAPCGTGLVCANAPETVVKGLQDAGFTARLETSEESGAPIISSAASGYDFTIYFFDCEEGAHCASLHFSISFADDGKNTPELANLWNSQRRFSQMAVDEDGSLDFTYDVSTFGGLTRRNFADVVDWWQTMLGALNAFFREQGHLD